MSWILGILSTHLSPTTIEKVKRVHPSPLSTFHIPRRCYIAVGGNELTLQWAGKNNSSVSPETFWAAAGCGISLGNDSCTILDHHRWQNLLQSSPETIRELGGHFVALRYNNHSIECFTDAIGFRTLYIAKSEESVFFSTRLDWIAQLINDARINLKVLGSRWLLFNQHGYESSLENVQRIGPGGYAKITATDVHIEHHPFTVTQKNETTPEELIDAVTSLLNPVSDSMKTISLGLSGGVDSRVLLSLILSRNDTRFVYHTFGVPADPDVIIARRIAASEYLRHTVYNEPLPDRDTCVTMMYEYISQTNLVLPVSVLTRLRYYAKLKKRGVTLIDGAFGEMARRSYLNRVALFGRRALQKFDIAEIYRHVQSHRANIFVPEVVSVMKQGAMRDIEESLHAMPSVKEIGAENFLDLWALRTRLPNFGSDEQARLDGELLNYLPFGQPQFFRAALRLPLRLRRNGKLFRRIIKRYHPSFTSYPFVKNNSTYPFYLSNTTSWIWTRLKNRFRDPFVDTSTHDFLLHIKDFVLDTVHTSHVKNYSLYDYPAILSNVTAYYAGRKELAGEVNWWIAFEVWRQCVEKKKAGSS